jgi:hypothetical protein
MMRPARPAKILYYVDADVLGLARELMRVRTDVTYPGDPGGLQRDRRLRAPCPVTASDARDEVWIPATAREGWLIITRDRHIQDHPAELAAVRDSGARVINLSGRDATTTFRQLEVLLCNWRDIESKLVESGPFIYSATRTGGLKAIPLGVAERFEPQPPGWHAGCVSWEPDRQIPMIRTDRVDPCC